MSQYLSISQVSPEEGTRISESLYVSKSLDRNINLCLCYHLILIARHTQSFQNYISVHNMFFPAY